VDAAVETGCWVIATGLFTETRHIALVCLPSGPLINAM
jgi:hypothetical protein